jgi:hypothetical protein
MSDLSYRIALQYLTSKKTLSQMKDIVLEMMKDVKKGTIKDKKDFTIILKENEIESSDLIHILRDEIDRNKEMSDFILYLGESDKGIGLIPNSWFARNLDDTDIIKKVPEKYWGLLRKPEWIKQHSLQ